MFDEFADQEWLALDLIIALGINQKLAAKQQPQLTLIEFRHEHLLVVLENLSEVPRELIQVTQVGVRHRLALRDELAHRRSHRPIRRRCW